MSTRTTVTQRASESSRNPFPAKAGTVSLLILTGLFFLGMLFLGNVAAQETAETYLQENGSRAEDTHGQSRLLHYLPEDIPIAVFVPVPDVQGGEALQQEVVRAFRSWNAAAPELIRFSFLDAPAPDALTVTWTEFADGRSGSYRYAYRVLEEEVYRFRATEVLLDPRRSPEATYPFALLQVGHALGLLGRSPFEGDAMSRSPSGVISDRDVATLRALYALPSGTPVGE